MNLPQVSLLMKNKQGGGGEEEEAFLSHSSLFIDQDGESRDAIVANSAPASQLRFNFWQIILRFRLKLKGSL